MRTKTRKEFLTGLGCLCAGSLVGSVVRGNIGGQHAVLANGEDSPHVPYVTDGLAFLGEEIAPPDSGTQFIDLNTEIDIANWTIDWCGIHLDNKRATNFMFPFGTKVNANSWCPGWWVNADGIHINARLYYADIKSSQQVKTLCYLANTISNASVMKMYAEGIQFSENSSSLVQSALNSISDKVIRYIICPSADYVYVKSIRVYDRPLSAEEIAFNHEIDLERFGN